MPAVRARPKNASVASNAVLTAARLDPRRFRTLLLYGEIEAGEGDMSYLLSAEPGVLAIPVPGLSRDVLWYHADYVAPSWGRRLSKVQKIGTHIFYRS